MHIFKNPNLIGGWKCPICKKSNKRPVTLIGKAGTQQGNLMEGEQVHVDCLDLTIDEGGGIIYMIYKERL